MSVPLKLVKDLISEAIDQDVVERGRKRQSAVWTGREADYIPLLLGHTEVTTAGHPHDRRWKLAEHELTGGVIVPEFFEHPHYSLGEQLDSPEKMLYEALWEVLSWARSKSDAQLAVRPYILHSVPELLGAGVEVSEAYGAFIATHPDKDTLRDIDASAIKPRGLFGKLLEFCEYFVANVPDGIHVYPTDTGGPMNTAQSLRGDDILTDFYEDPEFVHQLLDQCTEACIRSCRMLKQAVGEEDTVGYHGSLFMAKGAVRVVDDSSVVISPEMHREFIMPGIQRIFSEFGGGWYHSCGYYPQLIDNLLSAPEVTAINFGNPEQWPEFPETIGQLIAAGKIYYGAVYVESHDKLEQTLLSILQQTGGQRKGMIVFLKGDNIQNTPQATMDLWHRLQDEILN